MNMDVMTLLGLSGIFGQEFKFIIFIIFIMISE